MILPNALIIGAPRSGTTTLFHQLGKHPRIYVAAGKELHFFDEHFDRGLAWYAEQFAGATTETVVMEATPMYMSNRSAIDRIASSLPDAVLIALLRDPCERARSHFHYRVARGLDAGTLEAAIAREERGEQGAFPYIRIGRYHEHLESVRTSGHGGRVVLLWYDDLRDQPSVIQEALSVALGVDIASMEWGGTVVNSSDRFRSLRVRRLASRAPSTVRRVLGRMNRVETSYPPLTTATRERMLESLAPDIERLAQMTGRDLTPWLTPLAPDVDDSG